MEYGARGIFLPIQNFFPHKRFPLGSWSYEDGNVLHEGYVCTTYIYTQQANILKMRFQTGYVWVSPVAPTVLRAAVSLGIQNRNERRGIRYQIIAADLEDRKGIVRDDVP